MIDTKRAENVIYWLCNGFNTTNVSTDPAYDYRHQLNIGSDLLDDGDSYGVSIDIADISGVIEVYNINSTEESRQIAQAICDAGWLLADALKEIESLKMNLNYTDITLEPDEMRL